ncbi:sphingolipid delta-4 desaturase [Kwoniella mangroviensis CBS 10435]|uniref:sphingolipid 4-desaturase n=1 Tax=Kwoniella mangroviensis CBS 10435 TaxID=1331196 RepID=A0A1B9IH71_9TREE|nr:sphingolipid delta-4 desaturase [Kwoniella mangroviensis CBS 8507]OCF54777.1 sphingolipid delta-4 desaturase [Kwoniella mangroviensis CBS 10435]OCF64235.1 sphingolipid delta-4 desaturase [Kwoniella mangroviensis CBS 8507]OCF78589.1 sphingolipid delta-4 desaturase [Kwoniella mangroviensis CBS 8886]
MSVHVLPHPPATSFTPKAKSSLKADTASSTTSSPELSSYESSENGVDEVSEPNISAEKLRQIEKMESNPDFLWMTTEEPHRSRRMAILKAHPEVRKLMGPTLTTPPTVALVLTIQFTAAYLLRSHHPFSIPFILTAYIVGGTANQNTFLSIHEITHNLAFKSIKANKILAIISNLAIGIPYAMAFKGYHIEHHKFLGEDGIDTDLPSKLEAMILDNVAGKTFFATFQILFYALRPGFIRSQKPTIWHGINLLAILAFDVLLVKNWGWNSLIYLIMSSFFAGSLHPCAAHFIAEHYLMNGPLPTKEELVKDGQGDNEDWLIQGLAQETTSYYGWLNVLCYNVGYHNEHHDFPSVPWTKLPELHRIAKEFYDPLPSHESWPYVTWKFITDPSIGMWSRAKRLDKGDKIDHSFWTPLIGSDGEVQSKKETSDVLAQDEEEEEIAYMSDSCTQKNRSKKE